MRITLDMEGDIFEVAKELVAIGKSAVKGILSPWTRRGFKGNSASGSTKNGVPLLPASAEVVTLGHVQRLMVQEGI